MGKALYVYVDESGDIGVTKDSSYYFVMCALATTNPFEIARVIKRARKGVLGKQLGAAPELKFAKSPDSIRYAILEALAECEDEMWYVFTKKRKSGADDKKAEPTIYDSAATSLVNRVADTGARKIDVTIDKFLNKTNQERLNSEMEERIQETGKKMGRISISTSYRHITGQEEPCLQAVDFVSGAIFRKYEYSDASYYKVIQKKITKIEEL